MFYNINYYHHHHATLMMIVEATETCCKLIMCDKTYLVRVHLLVSLHHLNNDVFSCRSAVFFTL